MKYAIISIILSQSATLVATVFRQFWPAAILLLAAVVFAVIGGIELFSKKA